MVPNEDQILKHFLYYVLGNDTERIKAEGGRGIAMIHITKSGIERRLIPTPSLNIQDEIVRKIESEENLIEANKRLIILYEQKIKDRISNVWGE